MALPATHEIVAGAWQSRRTRGVLALVASAALLGCTPARYMPPATPAPTLAASVTATATPTFTPPATPAEEITTLSAVAPDRPAAAPDAVTSAPPSPPRSAESTAPSRTTSVTTPEAAVVAVPAAVEASTASAASGANADPTSATAAASDRAPSHAQFPPPPARPAPAVVSASGIARITSARLGLDHYIEDVGIVNNEMETPDDASYSVGWYHTYDRPGLAGNVILSAHETWNHLQGPFYSLYLAEPGDEIELRMATGVVYRYRVTTNTRYAVETMPMAEILWPTARPANGQWLTLITCGGRLEYDASGFAEYLDRDVIVAERFD